MFSYMTLQYEQKLGCDQIFVVRSNIKFPSNWIVMQNSHCDGLPSLMVIVPAAVAVNTGDNSRLDMLVCNIPLIKQHYWNIWQNLTRSSRNKKWKFWQPHSIGDELYTREWLQSISERERNSNKWGKPNCASPPRGEIQVMQIHISRVSCQKGPICHA